MAFQTGFAHTTILGYKLAAMGTKPETLLALQNSQVVASAAALTMGCPAVRGLYRLFQGAKYRILRLNILV